MDPQWGHDFQAPTVVGAAKVVFADGGKELLVGRPINVFEAQALDNRRGRVRGLRARNGGGRGCGGSAHSWLVNAVPIRSASGTPHVIVNDPRRPRCAP